ncbi:apolipo protein O-domain-containing protein [Triangularia verruculosa]|uniref:MICOS complex subunit n=1 Tax=Triangularia verruculosa TaxID=2587418 RepID=A0AAN6XR55_9PEZI|nr:apolipo protein O-domain-containing protein [Triangularia verruculosa]
MAARLLFQRRAAPLTAAVLVGSIAFSPAVAHAESPNGRQFPRKPIYDDDLDDLISTSKTLPPPPPPSPQTKAVEPAPSTSLITLPETPSVKKETPTDLLASHIRSARLYLYHHSCTLEDAVNSSLSRAFDLEQSFTTTISNLAPDRASGEKLMPGAIYVLVAGMAGSIIARNRNVLLRTATPLALGITAAWTVLPVTMNNVSELLWYYEKKVPAVAEAHLQVRESVEKGVYMGKVHAELAQRKIEEGVREVREAVEGWVRKGK